MDIKKKIIRATTVPTSLNIFCRGMLKELSNEYEVVALSSPGPEIEEIREREGVKCIEISMQRHISLIQDFRTLWKMYGVMKREQPYMIHSMTPKAGLLCMIAAKMAGVPVRIHTFTGLVFPTASGLKRQILMMTDRLTCACATHIIPEGEGVKNDLIINHVTKKPLKVLGFGNVRGIDLDYYDRTPSVMQEAEKLRKKDFFTFIFIGRLVGDKGINELVEAFSKLNKEFPKSRLVLVGPEERRLDPLKTDTIESIESQHCIEAVGRQSDVRPWLVMADAAILPSYREGFPNVVIEAGAMGLPQIVTDINGSREIIINGKNGIVIPPHSVSLLYDAMKLFITCPAYVKELSSQARRMIAYRYEQSFVRQCLYDYYAEVLGK